MASNESIFTLLTALLLFTSFVKITTALTVFRYGAGLIGFEFGLVCLLASFCLSIVAAPPELAKIGFPQRFFSSQEKLVVEDVSKALLPFMSARVDPQVAKAMADLKGDRSQPESATGDVKAAEVEEISTVAPAFLISELKRALSIGLMLLIPFIAIDLVVAHILTLVGVAHLSAGVVSLPLKLLLFAAVDGWSLLATKLLAA
jgi:flagellar biosynthesis protein FliP